MKGRPGPGQNAGSAVQGDGDDNERAEDFG